MPTYGFKQFNDGFLVLNATGGTSNGRVLLRLTDITISQSRDVDETITFDTPNFTKIVQPTYHNWNVSCSGIISTDTGESEFAGSASGDTKIVNTYNGLELVEVIKTRTTNAHIIIKLSDSNYQKGNVVITSMEVSGSAGSKLTYSLEMQGYGELTKATS
jgi:hypothetical protein